MSDEDLEYAKRLLRIVDVIENYNYYLMRRSIGMIFVIIIALTAIIINFISMVEHLFELSYITIGILYFFSFSLFFLIIIFLSHNIGRIPIIYATKRVDYRDLGKVWSIIGALILISAIIIYSTEVPDFYFFLTMQSLYGIGFISSYLTTKNKPNFPGKINLEFVSIGLIQFLTAPLILIYPKYSGIIAFMVITIGTFIFGIYLILTANNVFKKREKRDETRDS